MAIAASVTPIDPITLGARLFEYWDASQVGTLSLTGALVNSWASRKTGTLVPAQATSGFKPVYSATGFYGKPGVTFDGTDDYLNIDAVGAQPVGAGACEIITLGSQLAPLPDGAAARRIAGYGGALNTGFRLAGKNGSDFFNMSVGIGTGNSSSTILSPLTGRFISCGRVGMTEVVASLDSPLFSVAPTPGVPVTLALRTRIGATTSNTPSQFWNGAISRHIVCDLLTDAERAGIFAFLAQQ